MQSGPLLLLLLAALSAAEQCGGLGGSGLCRADGPSSVAQQPAWLAALRADRAATDARTGFAGGVFGTPALSWTATAYVQTQMHPFHRYFYDRGSGSSSTTTTNSSSTTARNFTVDRYLDDATARYGGLDAALVWPSYLNLGVDDRNQIDMFRALPGRGWTAWRASWRRCARAA